MPRLTIDGRSVEVPEGTKVIEAAERLGIMIPRFCYHPALGSVGACRVCAVMFLEGPVKGVQMSCMEEARDGMVVSTTDQRAVAFRRDVLEWLMLNHPHDCPVCDEGGHCLLQDMTVSSGHGRRRYAGPKRTFRNQYLGPLVDHEMNRCIQCYRCRRFYQEFAGYRDLGALQIANKVYFGRSEEGPLESPFAGNLIDVCPTGVFTDRAARYRVRQWELERAPTLCVHCSLGCHAIGNAKYRQVWRLEARLSERINGHFLCDRGRFGFAYEHAPDRPRRARVPGLGETSVELGLRTAGERLGRLDPLQVACLASPRASLETLTALVHLSRSLGWRPPAFFSSAEEAAKARAATVSYGGRRVSLRDLETADFALVVGADPLAEAPMLALALRQMARRGGRVVVADPRPVALPFAFEHVAVRPPELDRGMRALASGAEGGDGWPELRELGRALREAKDAVLVCGAGVTLPTTAAAAGEAAAAVGSGVFYVLPGANSFGAALLSREGKSLPDLLEGIEEGTIRGLVVAEANPFGSCVDRGRLEAALGRLELLLVLDYLPSPTTARAPLFLPTQTIYEAGGTYVNGEGRAQRARPVYRSGLPIRQETGGSHPPRLFRREVPEGDPRPAWELLAELGRALSPAYSSAVPPWPEGLAALDPESEGVLLPLERASERPPEERPTARPEGLELLFVEETFGTEELSSYSEPLRELEQPPWVALHPADAAGAGLASGDLVRVVSGGPAAVLRTPSEMAQGVLLVPRRSAGLWQNLRDRAALRADELRKVT